MKVFVLTEGINFGGQQYYIHNLFKELKKINSNNKFLLDLGYLFNESNDLESLFYETFKEVNYYSLPGRSKMVYIKNPIKSILHISRTIHSIRKKKYDVIFSNGFYSFLICVILKLFNKRIQHVRLIGGDLSRNERFYFNSIWRFVPLYKFTDLVLAWPQQIHFLRTKNINVRTLDDFNSMYAVDSDLFCPKPKNYELKKRLGIDPDYSVIGWVGRIAPDLEYPETLQMCQYIMLNFPDFKFKLLIIGNGMGVTDLYNDIDQMGLSDNVVHVSYVEQKFLPDYYSIIDYEVLLDLDPQGGSHVREAMACGRVVITVNGKSGVQSEIIQNNITGILVDPQNRIQDAALKIVNMSNELKNEIGNNARCFITEYSYNSLSLVVNSFLNDVNLLKRNNETFK
jgi:glycosyltransferase involved in cell wall biosynthesis